MFKQSTIISSITTTTLLQKNTPAILVLIGMFVYVSRSLDE